MYLAMSMDGKTLENNVSQQFETAKYLLVVDTTSLSVSAIENCESFSAESLAQKVIDLNCEGIITGAISHPQAFEILADACITRFWGSGKTGMEALDLMKKRELKLIRTIDGTDGCGGDHNHQTEKTNHAELAMDLFRQGYNCSQAVLLAFSDECGLDFEMAARLSSSFGAGMGRLREVCGAVTGMFMVAGVLYGYRDPQDQVGKTTHYQRIQDLAKQFEDKNQSIICRELLGLEAGKDSPVPERRTEAYYRNRPCEDLVGMAAAMMAAYIEGQKLHQQE